MADITPATIRVERVATGEVWDYQKGNPRTTYIYVYKLGDKVTRLLKVAS